MKIKYLNIKIAVCTENRTSNPKYPGNSLRILLKGKSFERADVELKEKDERRGESMREGWMETKAILIAVNCCSDPGWV